MFVNSKLVVLSPTQLIVQAYLNVYYKCVMSNLNDKSKNQVLHMNFSDKLCIHIN